MIEFLICAAVTIPAALFATAVLAYKAFCAWLTAQPQSPALQEAIDEERRERQRELHADRADRTAELVNIQRQLHELKQRQLGATVADLTTVKSRRR